MSNALEQKFNMKFGEILPILTKISDHLYRRYKVYAPHQELTCHPFFIIGSGRNGSTLLSSMLNQHSKLMVPPEQWVLYEMIIKFKLYNIIEWKDLVNICVGLYADDSSNEGWETHFGHLYSKLHSLNREERTLTKIVDEIYVTHGKQKNIQFESWGEKSPINTVYLRYIYPVYPRSKYIFLIRDGRDVVSSITKVRGRDLEYAVWRWNYSIKQFDWLKSKVSRQQFCIVRFEDLVLEPEKTLRSLLNFLNYDFEESMLEYQKSVNYLGLDKYSYHKNVQRPLKAGQIGKWQERLTNDEINELMPKIEHNLKIFGYSD